MKLDFKEHLKNTVNEVTRTTALMHKFQKIMPRPTLTTIYKLFIKPYLDYGYIVNDQAYKIFSHQMLELI